MRSHKKDKEKLKKVLYIGTNIILYIDITK